jgi:hypothetical protein
MMIFWVQVFSHHTVFLSLDSHQSSDSRPSSRYLRIARVPHFTDMIVRQISARRSAPMICRSRLGNSFLFRVFLIASQQIIMNYFCGNRGLPAEN